MEGSGKARPERRVTLPIRQGCTDVSGGSSTRVRRALTKEFNGNATRPSGDNPRMDLRQKSRRLKKGQGESGDSKSS